MTRRAAIIVLDGLGIGPAFDTDAYGDGGSNTLGNVAMAVGGLDLPNLSALGLGNCAPLAGIGPSTAPTAAYGVCEPSSPGKDSTTGHWEICGLILPAPFPTFPEGFPAEVIEEFSRRTGRGVLGNRPASGTQMLDALGEEHRRTGKWIVYTSADSVFQVAAHEETVPLAELYAACRSAREMLQGRARRLARHRASVRGPSRRVGAHAASQGLQPAAAGPDAARPSRREARASSRCRQGGRPLRRPRDLEHPHRDERRGLWPDRRARWPPCTVACCSPT